MIGLTEISRLVKLAEIGTLAKHSGKGKKQNNVENKIWMLVRVIKNEVNNVVTTLEH